MKYNLKNDFNLEMSKKKTRKGNQIDGKKLTLKQKRFANAYAVGHNGTQAAKIAGYADKSSGQQANVLMKNPQINSHIETQRKLAEEKLGISLEYCAKQYIELAILSRKEKDNATSKSCIDSLSKLMNYLPKENRQVTENKVQFELLLKQLDSTPKVKELNAIVSDVQTCETVEIESTSKND